MLTQAFPNVLTLNTDCPIFPFQRHRFTNLTTATLARHQFADEPVCLSCSLQVHPFRELLLPCLYQEDSIVNLMNTGDLLLGHRTRQSLSLCLCLKCSAETLIQRHLPWSWCLNKVFEDVSCVHPKSFLICEENQSVPSWDTMVVKLEEQQLRQ